MINIFFYSASLSQKFGSGQWVVRDLIQGYCRGCSHLKTWQARRSTSQRLTHVASQCWVLQETSVSWYMVLSIGLLECPHNMAAGFPHIKWSKREKGGSLASTIIYFKSHTLSCPQCHCWYHRSSIQHGRKIHKGWTLGDEEHWRSSCRLTTVPSKYFSFKRSVKSKVPKVWSSIIYKLFQNVK